MKLMVLILWNAFNVARAFHLQIYSVVPCMQNPLWFPCNMTNIIPQCSSSLYWSVAQARRCYLWIQPPSPYFSFIKFSSHFWDQCKLLTNTTASVSCWENTYFCLLDPATCYYGVMPPNFCTAGDNKQPFPILSMPLKFSLPHSVSAI